LYILDTVCIFWAFMKLTRNHTMRWVFAVGMRFGY
jgi:hypothetical protein